MSDGAVVPCVSYEGWMPELLGQHPYEAKCGRCPDRHGPDSEPSCWAWMERHLKRAHGVTITHRVRVPQGGESIA